MSICIVKGKKIKLVGIEACPLSEWFYSALVGSGFETICIEARHAHVKSKASQLLRTTLVARKKFVGAPSLTRISVSEVNLIQINGSLSTSI